MMDLNESLLKIGRLPLGDLVNLSFLLQIVGTPLVEKGKIDPNVYDLKLEVLIETLNAREQKYSKEAPVPDIFLGLAVYRLGKPFGVNCTENDYIRALSSFDSREEIYFGGSFSGVDSLGRLIEGVLYNYLKILRKPELVVPLIEQVAHFITKINHREQLYLLDPSTKN